MDWNRVNVWTNTLYTLIHALHLSRRIHFGNLPLIGDSLIEAGTWVTPECSYSSVLMAYPFGKAKVTFRRDPNRHFVEIAAQTVKMLTQDLVVIFDEMMADALTAKGEQPDNFPQGKVRQLMQRLDEKHQWAAQGCLELIAARNVLTHGGGRWNERSIDIVRPFLQPVPIVGDKLSIGIPMLFRYRKAMRTLLNEVSRPNPAAR